MNGDESSPAVDDSGVYEDYACDLSYGFSLTGTKRWTDTFGCEGGGGATTVLNGSHLYLHGGNGGPGALIVSTATGARSGTFGGTGMPAFDATNMYVVNGGVLDAADRSGSPAHWSFTGDGTIDTTSVTQKTTTFPTAPAQLGAVLPESCKRWPLTNMAIKGRDAPRCCERLPGDTGAGCCAYGCLFPQVEGHQVAALRGI
jgi:hypothetical protein